MKVALVTVCVCVLDAAEVPRPLLTLVGSDERHPVSVNIRLNFAVP
jgi:hypothetical protein